MSSKTLCFLMRIAVIAVTLCLLFLCVWLLPLWGTDITTANSEFEHWLWPWMILLWVSSLPLFAILVYVWKVAGAVKHEEVFTIKTAKWVKIGSVLLFADVGFFFMGNLIFWFIGINRPEILLLSIFIDVIAITLSVLIGVLSRYLIKAAVLQEESEGTI